MNKKFLKYLGIIVIVVSVSFSGIVRGHSASKDLIAGKREKFEDDSADSMRDLLGKRELENKVYKEKVLSKKYIICFSMCPNGRPVRHGRDFLMHYSGLKIPLQMARRSPVM